MMRHLYICHKPKIINQRNTYVDISFLNVQMFYSVPDYTEKLTVSQIISNRENL